MYLHICIPQSSIMVHFCRWILMASLQDARERTKSSIYNLSLINSTTSIVSVLSSVAMTSLDVFKLWRHRCRMNLWLPLLLIKIDMPLEVALGFPHSKGTDINPKDRPPVTPCCLEVSGILLNKNPADISNQYSQDHSPMGHQIWNWKLRLGPCKQI